MVKRFLKIFWEVFHKHYSYVYSLRFMVLWYNGGMDDRIRRNIIGAIRHDLSDRFRVFDNTGLDRKIVSGMLPDVLLMRQEPPKNDDILFIMRIENGNNLIDSVAEWKEMDKASVSSYIVVPENKLNEAKKLASAVGIFARFASYTLDHNNKASVVYE